MTSATLSLVVLAALLFLLWAGQRGMMYFPVAELPSPVALGLEGVESVTFATADGVSLGGWFFPVGEPGPRGSVIVFNGNAGNRAHRVPLARALGRHGFQVLLTDYRGYGGNPGAPTEAGLASDARAAQAYLSSRPDVDASRIVYFGESLGTAVAIDLATDHPPAALVLRSPFTSMVDIGRYHYRFLPVGWLLRDRYASIDRIRQVRAPLLVIAGERDRIVPIEYSRRLYEAAGEPKAFVPIPGADHNDPELLAGEAMVSAVVGFLAASMTTTLTP